MPGDVRDRINRAGVMDAYRDRPHYQRNDYLGWIARETTRDAREAHRADDRGAPSRRGVHEHGSPAVGAELTADRAPSSGDPRRAVRR